MIIMSVLRSLLFTLILVEFVKGAPVSDPANNNVVGQVETNTIGEWTQSDDDLIGENSQPLEGSGHLYDFEHDDTESDDKEVSDNPIEDSREVDGSEHDDDDDDDYYDDLGDPLYFRYDNMYTYWEQYPHYTVVKGAPVSDPADKNNIVVGQVETNTIGEWTQSDDDIIGEKSQPLEGSGHLDGFEHGDTESDDKEVTDNPIEVDRSEHDDKDYDDEEEYDDYLMDPNYNHFDHEHPDWDSSGEDDTETITKVKEPGQEGDVNEDDVIKVDVTSKEGAEKGNINKEIQTTTEDDVIKGEVKSIDVNKYLDFENKEDGKKKSEENVENKKIGILSDKLLKMEDEFLKKIEDSKETNLEKLK